MSCRTVITERNRAVVALRNHGLRALTRVPGVNAGLQKLTWIPGARYRDGFFAAGKTRAVGWQIPQPWVAEPNGARIRLDDLLGGQWAILHIGPAPAGAQEWTRLDVPLIQITDAPLIRWLGRKKAAAVVLRPDGFIYAAAQSGHRLPKPPPGYSGNTVTTPSKTEVSA